jgi:hypothetical protein
MMDSQCNVHTAICVQYRVGATAAQAGSEKETLISKDTNLNIDIEDQNFDIFDIEGSFDKYSISGHVNIDALTFNIDVSSISFCFDILISTFLRILAFDIEGPNLRYRIVISSDIEGRFQNFDIEGCTFDVGILGYRRCTETSFSASVGGPLSTL